MMPFRMVMKAAGDADDDTGEDKEMIIAMGMGIGSDIIVDTDGGGIENTTTTALDMDAIEAAVGAGAEAGGGGWALVRGPGFGLPGGAALVDPRTVPRCIVFDLDNCVCRAYYGEVMRRFFYS